MAEETRTVTATFAEAQAGLELRAGSSIVILITDGTGTALSDSAGDDLADPAPAQAGGGTSSLTDAPAAGTAAPAAGEGTLDIQLFTAAGAPGANFEVELTLPDGTKEAGKTGADGHFVPQHLPNSGNCSLQVPDIDEAAPAAVTPAAPAGRLAYQKDMSLPIGTPAAIQLPPRVHRGELTGAHFETDKTFLLPTAMPGIKQLVIIYKS